MFDVAIIGSGPAGISAVINASIREKKYIWFGSKGLSEKAAKAEKVKNYPGLFNISGKEFIDILKKQIDDMNICLTDKRVQMVMKNGEHFMISAENEIFEAKTVLIASGVSSAKKINGENEFLGRGVSYCATCDGMFYKGKDVAVLCNSKEFESDIEYLQGIVNNLFLIPMYKGDKDYGDNVIKLEKKYPVEIVGDNAIREIRFADGTTKSVDGFFILKDTVSLDNLVNGIKLENGHVETDRKMSTNIEGCFAAGDCTGRPYQYTKAVGEGNVAMHSIIEYLSKQEDK